MIFTGCSGATSSDLAAITGVPDTGSVTVISGGGGSATPTPTPAPGAAATIVLVSGNLQDVPVNTQASSSLIVLIRDASNQPIASEAVTFLVSGHGSVSSILTTTNASGLASVNFTADGSAGAAIVTATSAQGSVVFNLNVVALSSYTMQIVSGNNTTDAIGAAVSPLKVRVLNGSGAPASLVSVTYTIQTGNGNFSGASSRVVLTDSNGYAESTFNLGTTGGSNTIKAALTSSAGVFATFTETGTVPSTSVVDLAQSTIELSQNSSQANGSNLVTVTVKVRDQYQNLIPNSSQPVTVTFSPSVGAWVSASTLNYASTGTYTNTYRVGSSATTVVFTAFYGVASFTSGTASLILNTGLVTGAQGATLSLVAGNSQTVQISQTASAALKVLALDSLGIPISGSSVTFTVVTAGGGTLTGGLSSATVTTGVDGTAEVNFTAGSSAGSVSISANSVQGTVGFSLTVQDLTGYTIEKINSLQTDNQTALLNARLAQDVSVRVLNAGGTPVQGMLVRFQCQSVNCGQFTNGQNSIDVATNSSGISSAGYYVGTAPGVYTVRAIIPPQAGIFTDFTETATVDPASSVSLLNTTVALSSSSVTADGNQTVTVTVALKDSYGNVIPNDSNSVVVTPSPSSLGA